MTITLLPGKSYDIRFYVPAIMGSALWKRATVTSIGTYNPNRMPQVASTHASMYSALPQNTPIDPAQLLYYTLKLQSGEERITANAWIQGDPVEVGASGVTIALPDASTADIAILTDLLLSAGYTTFSFD